MKKKIKTTETMDYEAMSTYALWQIVKEGPNQNENYGAAVAEINTRAVAEDDLSQPELLRGGIKPNSGNTH